MIVHTSIGGRRARVQLSNAFGTAPLKIGAAHIALRDKESAIVAASDHALTFSGQPSFTIPPGAEILSDPVDIDIPKLGDLVISVYVPGRSRGGDDACDGSPHDLCLETRRFNRRGLDRRRRPNSQAWYSMSSVDVLAPPTRDSSWLTAIRSLTAPPRRRTRTAAGPVNWRSGCWETKTANVAVINEGISGNRVLSDGAGISALARFDRDVLATRRVLGHFPGRHQRYRDGPRHRADAITADELIAAHKQIIERAHMQGIKVIGATLTPFAGAAYYSEEGSKSHGPQHWIRNGKAYDAVIDFDAATRDPENPKQIRALIQYSRPSASQRCRL